jgi:hypothetical protein
MGRILGNSKKSLNKHEQLRQQTDDQKPKNIWDHPQRVDDSTSVNLFSRGNFTHFLKN